MITFGQIRDRIEPMRNATTRTRQAQMAFQVGARRLASETFGLQEIVDLHHARRARSRWSPTRRPARSCWAMAVR